jgi:hypothetical protein
MSHIAEARVDLAKALPRRCAADSVRAVTETDRVVFGSPGVTTVDRAPRFCQVRSFERNQGRAVLLLDGDPGIVKAEQKAAMGKATWFENVELLAARSIGQVTVMYVRNIYKSYVAYKLALEQSRLL